MITSAFSSYNRDSISVISTGSWAELNTSNDPSERK